MKLLLGELLDEGVDVPRWWERQLLSASVARLASELQAIRGPGDSQKVLADVLSAEALQRVFAAGLASLTHEEWNALLEHPHLLVALRDAVLEQGQTYWDELLVELVRTEAPEAQSASQSGRRPAAAEQDGAARSTVDSAIVRPAGVWLATTWARRPLAVALLSCAATLLATAILWRAEPRGGPAPASAWTDPALLRPANSPTEYVARLAQAARGLERPDPARAVTLDQLVRQLAIAKHGCTIIALHQHVSLSPNAQLWLQQICRDALDEINGAWSDLEHGFAPRDIQSRLDATLRRLAENLAHPDPALLIPPEKGGQVT